MQTYLMKLGEFGDFNLRIITPEVFEETTLENYRLAFSLAVDLISDKRFGKRCIPTKNLFDYVVKQEFPYLKVSSDYIATGSSEGDGIILVFR